MVLIYPSSLNNLPIERWKRYLGYLYFCISWKKLQILYTDFYVNLSSISEENGECSFWLVCSKHMLGFAKRMYSYSSRVNNHAFLIAKWIIQFSASTTRLGIIDNFNVSHFGEYLLLSHSGSMILTCTFQWLMILIVNIFSCAFHPYIFFRKMSAIIFCLFWRYFWFFIV